MPNQTASPRRLLEQYCAAFERRSAAEIGALFAPAAVFDDPLQDRRLVGVDDIVAGVSASLMAAHNIRVKLDVVAEGEGDVFAEGTFYAENIAIPAAVDGTPSRLDFRFVAILEAEDGRITRLTEYFDTRPLRPRERTRLYPITRRSPYWEGTVEAGVAEFMIYNHTFFPLVYTHAPAEEYKALTERVTLWDVGCERQTELRGPDALRLAQFLTTRDLSKLKPGVCKYTLCCDPAGKILCDPVLIMPEQDVIWLSHGDVDLTLWAQGIALAGGYDVAVGEPDVAPVQVQGPRSLDVMRKLVEQPVDDLGFYKCMPNRVAGIDAVVSRTGWSGGLGYEIFPLSSAHAMELWRAILVAGAEYDIIVIGPNVNRAIEKGVTDTAYYTNSDQDPYEAGHGRLVDLEKGDFVGRNALARAAASPPKRKTVGLFIEGDLPLLEWYWPISANGAPAGEVRWAAHSFALDRSLGIAIVDAGLNEGDEVIIHQPLGDATATLTTVPFVS